MLLTSLTLKASYVIFKNVKLKPSTRNYHTGKLQVWGTNLTKKKKITRKICRSYLNKMPQPLLSEEIVIISNHVLDIA